MNPLRRQVRFECNACGKVTKIPLRRVHVFEAFEELEDRHPLLLECHQCRAGVRIPASYRKASGVQILVDPQNIDPDAPVFVL